MKCDCDYPKIYRFKTVTVHKQHKCCECGNVIQSGNCAEKVDALWDRFSTIYTCLACVAVRDRIKVLFPDDICGHGGLYDYLWSSDLLWDEDEILEEAAAWVPDCDLIIQGSHFVIATHVSWLRWQNGRLHVVDDKSDEK